MLLSVAVAVLLHGGPCAADIAHSTMDLRVAWVTVPAGARCHEESHEFAEIRYVTEGSARWTLGDETFTVNPGTAVLIPKEGRIDSGAIEHPMTWVSFRWATGGDEQALHLPSTMTDPVRVLDIAPPDIELKRYVAGAAETSRNRVHIDAIQWTTNWTYSEDLWKVYRYKPLARAPLADWEGISRSDVRMGLQELDPRATYPGHHHPSPEVYVVLSGRARWTLGEKSFEATPGSVIYTPPNTRHRIENTDDTRLRWLYFWWASGGSATRPP